VAAAGQPLGIAATNDGQFVYAAAQSSSLIRGYEAAGSGALSPLSPATFATNTTGAAPGGTLVTPNQGPQAAFNPAVSPTTKTVQFNGSGSVDPDGTIARFFWDFGDGTTKATTSQTTKHTYADEGEYTATLGVIDDEGCAGVRIFTGQIVSCAGSAAAATTRTFQISAAGGFKPKLKAPAKQAQGGNKLKVRLKAGASTATQFSATGKVKAGKAKTRLRGVNKNSKAQKFKQVKLSATKDDSRPILRRLRKGRTAKARLKVQFVGNAGDRVTKKTTVKLVAR
jgi:PKD repeat protein